MKFAYLVGVFHYSGSLAYGVEFWEKSILHQALSTNAQKWTEID